MGPNEERVKASPSPPCPSLSVLYPGTLNSPTLSLRCVLVGAQIYGTNPASALKLNDIVELVGVVSWDPPATQTQQQHPAAAPSSTGAAAGATADAQTEPQASAPSATAGGAMQMLGEHDDVKVWGSSGTALLPLCHEANRSHP